MLSVIVITKNEELNLSRCLESVTWADETIIVDSGSTDGTLAIAQKFTSHVHVCPQWEGYGKQKQRALEFASGDWVLNLDADEAVSSELRSEIEQFIQSSHADAARIPIQMFFYGRPLNYSYSPKRHIRLFRRKGAQYSEDLVHEKIILPPNVRVTQFKNPIMHASFRDLNHALEKLNRYSSYSAHIRLQNKKTPIFSKVLLASVWMFLRCYLLEKGCFDGKAGLIMAVYNAQGTFYRGMKQLYPDLNFELESK